MMNSCYEVNCPCDQCANDSSSQYETNLYDVDVTITVTIKKTIRVEGFSESDARREAYGLCENLDVNHEINENNIDSQIVVMNVESVRL
jgi:hypothetical protein